MMFLVECVSTPNTFIECPEGHEATHVHDVNEGTITPIELKGNEHDNIFQKNSQERS